MMWRSRRDRELDDELRTHLEMAARDRMTLGESADEAADAARREFGNVMLVRESTREMWGWVRVERLLQDVRYALRVLRRSPTFSIVAIATLTIGISATSSVFSVLNAVRLRPLAIPRPQELVEIAPVSLDGARGNFHGWHVSVSNPVWEQIRDHQEALRGTLAYGTDTFNLAVGGEARAARGLYVSGSFFDVLEIVPEHGRLLTASDDRRGCPPRAVISHAFWQREFNGDRAVIGRTITLSSMPAEIIGVTPASFVGLEVGRRFDIAVPICAEAAIDATAGAYLESASDWWLTVMGRLAPGVTIEQAGAHMRNLSSAIYRATLAANYPPASVPKYLEMKLQVLPAATGISSLRETYEDALWVLLGLAGLVLLITCANLANLMLARGGAREGEIALRFGLGASRGRIVVQLLTESMLLAIAGALGGLALAQIFSGALIAFVDGAGQDVVLNVGPDARVIAFAFALTALTSVAFGLLPALTATRLGAAAVLQRIGRRLTVRERGWARRGLAVTQVAVSMVLLFGAVLFTRTLNNLTGVETGFRSDGIVMTGLDLRPVALPVERRVEYQQDIINRLRTIPGVLGVASTTVVPLSGNSSGNDITFETSSGAKTVNMLATRVSDGYFRTFATPLLEGRDFDPTRDTTTSPNVVIVNRTLAAMFDGGRAVGKRFRVEATTTAPVTEFEVIGVAADSKYLSLRQEPYPTVFYPLSQNPRPQPGLRLAVRTAVPTAAATAAIVDKMRELDPKIGATFMVFDTAIAATLVRERLMAVLSSFFGSIAAVLAVIGLYGLLAYAVIRRTNEIGVRIALGASRREIVRMILREAGALVGLGLVIGIALAIGSSRIAESLLFGLPPRDPLSIIGAAALLGAIGLLAGYLPARRASAIEPMRALRAE